MKTDHNLYEIMNVNIAIRCSPNLSKAAECTIYASKKCREYSIPYLAIHEINLERKYKQKLSPNV